MSSKLARPRRKHGSSSGTCRAPHLRGNRSRLRRFSLSPYERPQCHRGPPGCHGHVLPRRDVRWGAEFHYASSCPFQNKAEQTARRGCSRLAPWWRFCGHGQPLQPFISFASRSRHNGCSGSRYLPRAAQESWVCGCAGRRLKTVRVPIPRAENLEGLSSKRRGFGV
jgi:hypothetical protein